MTVLAVKRCCEPCSGSRQVRSTRVLVFRSRAWANVLQVNQTEISTCRPCLARKRRKGGRKSWPGWRGKLAEQPRTCKAENVQHYFDITRLSRYHTTLCASLSPVVTIMFPSVHFSAPCFSPEPIRHRRLTHLRNNLFTCAMSRATESYT